MHKTVFVCAAIN